MLIAVTVSEVNKQKELAREYNKIDAQLFSAL